MTNWLVSAAALALLAGCASSVPYQAADRSGGFGYAEQQIESDRYTLTYRDRDGAGARAQALRRAAELTLEAGADWFQVVSAYEDVERSGGGGSSVSIGGSGGNGRSGTGVGVGIGLGFPLGGGSSPTTQGLEIITGSGDAPEGGNVYMARDVLANLAE